MFGWRDGIKTEYTFLSAQVPVHMDEVQEGIRLAISSNSTTHTFVHANSYTTINISLPRRYPGKRESRERDCA